jgi:hypothetical protein
MVEVQMYPPNEERDSAAHPPWGFRVSAIATHSETLWKPRRGSSLDEMKFYVYRREDVPALDFSVRRASSEGPAFEFCDVLASGVAFGAGIRTGDRPTGVMGADTSASKNPHNWDEQSLGVLREAEAGTLFVLFVDKRVPLSRREGQHMKKRAEFISARKVRRGCFSMLPCRG